MSDDLLEIADELYALPLGEFTPARDARAKELKGTDLAARVKALKKPSLAAWVVNLLVRRETEQVEQVLDRGRGAARGAGVDVGRRAARADQAAAPADRGGHRRGPGAGAGARARR